MISDIIDAFSTISIYLDDILNINGKWFDNGKSNITYIAST